MSLLLAIIFTSFVFENKDLAVATLLYNASPDGYILQLGLPNLELFPVSKQDYLIQSDLAANLSWKPLKFYHGPGLGLILLATRLKYCIHGHTLQVRRSRAVSFRSAVVIASMIKKRPQRPQGAEAPGPLPT
jgi:hypothetical protein